MCIESDLLSHNVLEEMVKSQNIIVWDTARRRVLVGKQIRNLKVFSQNITQIMKLQTTDAIIELTESISVQSATKQYVHKRQKKSFRTISKSHHLVNPG